MNDYDAACAYHATAQGLDPFTQAAREAGLEVQVWQTGGFTMVAAVVDSAGALWTVTCEDGYILVRFDSVSAWDEDDEERYEVVGEQLTAEAVVEKIKRRG